MSYPITDIDGIDGEVAAVLKSVGIRSTDRLLEAARTVKGRKTLARRPASTRTSSYTGRTLLTVCALKACARSTPNCCRRRASIPSRSSSIETRSIR